MKNLEYRYSSIVGDLAIESTGDLVMVSVQDMGRTTHYLLEGTTELRSISDLLDWVYKILFVDVSNGVLTSICKHNELLGIYFHQEYFEEMYRLSMQEQYV